ncbi:MAG: type II toxin-antitoxin system VapC family toxin [Waterburya sp.]
MNGNRYLLDTNAIIALLQDDSSLIKLLQDASWLGISVISQIEFLAFSGLTEADIKLFHRFLQRVEVINLNYENEALIEQIISIRQQYRLKLPDAIIAAMVKQNSAKLVTRDRIFDKITDLLIANW